MASKGWERVGGKLRAALDPGQWQPTDDGRLKGDPPDTVFPSRTPIDEVLPPTRTPPTQPMLQDLVAGPAGPLVVYVLRATDVTMATIRMLMIMRGHRLVAPLIGFFEILLWVTAVGIVVRFLDSPLHVVGYAAGFATGNYMGLRIEERLALGVATVRTVVATGGAELAAELRRTGFGVTETPGRGKDGPVDVLYSVLPRKHMERCLSVIEEHAPDSFVVVDEPRRVTRGWLFPSKKK